MGLGQEILQLYFKNLLNKLLQDTLSKGELGDTFVSR